MNAKDVIRTTLQTGQSIVDQYLADLDDRDLLLRPVPQANHIAWQLGHLVASEREMVGALGHEMPELPAGFVEAHSPDNARSDGPRGFSQKQEYLDLMQRMRAGTLAALDRTPEADLEQPGPEAMRSYAPTVGAVFNMVGVHLLMHVGQFVPVRRKLGKPIAI